MIGSLPSNTFRFTSTFAGIPVEIQYEVEVSEDHRGADLYVLPMICILNGHEVDLCEDAGYFHKEQLKTWLTEAEADYKALGSGADFDDDDYTPTEYDAAAAEDRWIAERDHAHYSRAGL